MPAALTAQPGLYRAATAVSTKAKVRGKNRKRKKSTMTGVGRSMCNTQYYSTLVMSKVESVKRLTSAAAQDDRND